MSFRDYMRKVRASSVGTYVNVPRRFLMAARVVSQPAARVFPWLFSSKEDTNLTYELTELNTLYLAYFLSYATETPLEVVQSYIDEILNDDELKSHIIRLTQSGPYRFYADPRCDFGRRAGWYVLVRTLKPRVVVETGIDKGFGSVVLCAALLRNGCGSYYGTDINPRAGYLLRGKYAAVGKILYGDSIESLKALPEKIDLFVNDSDHSADYEMREYETITDKLSDHAIVVGDNSHVTKSLVAWSELHGRPFLFWREQPKNHWYPGGGIGLSLAVAT
jgi:Methyltransferase domain